MFVQVQCVDTLGNAKSAVAAIQVQREISRECRGEVGRVACHTSGLQVAPSGSFQPVRRILEGLQVGNSKNHRKLMKSAAVQVQVGRVSVCTKPSRLGVRR